MTTQQEQPQPQPQAEQPQELALRVGRLEGLMEMVIEQQRALSQRMDRLESRMHQLTLAVLGGAIVLAAAVVGSGFID